MIQASADRKLTTDPESFDFVLDSYFWRILFKPGFFNGPTPTWKATLQFWELQALPGKVDNQCTDYGFQEQMNAQWQRTTRRVKPRLNASRANGFFPYYLDEDMYPELDLSSIQIYAKTKHPVSGDRINCVFHALLSGGITSEMLQKVQMLDLKYSNWVSVANIRTIAETLKVSIFVKNYHNTTQSVKKSQFRTLKYGPKQKKGSLSSILTLVTIEGHAFLEGKAPCTMFYLKNPALCRNLVTQRGLQESPCLVRNASGRQVNHDYTILPLRSKVVRYLLDNDKCIPIDYYDEAIKRRPVKMQEGVRLDPSNIIVAAEPDQDEEEGESFRTVKRRQKEQQSK